MDRIANNLPESYTIIPLHRKWLQEEMYDLMHKLKYMRNDPRNLDIYKDLDEIENSLDRICNLTGIFS